MKKLTYIVCLLIVLGTAKQTFSMQRFSALLHRGYAQSSALFNKTIEIIKTGAQKSAEITKPHIRKVYELCQQHPRSVGSLSFALCAIPAAYALARSTKAHTIKQALQHKLARQLLRAGYIPTLPWALTHGANINDTFEDGKTALHLAAARGDAAQVKNILEYAANVDQVDSLGKKAVHYAAQNGNIAAIEQLLIGNADIYDALFCAVTRGQLETVKWLVQHGADHMYLLGGDNRNALDLLNMIKRTPDLIKHAPQFKLSPKQTIDRLTAVETYLKSLRPVPESFTETATDMSIHFTEVLRITEVLRKAIDNKSVNQAIIGIQSGASLVAKDEKLSPLNRVINAPSEDAQERGQLDAIAQALVKAGAPLHNKDADGNTPLLHAAAAGNIRLVELFLKHGANTQDRNKNGQNSLDIALAHHQAQMAEFLFKKGLQISPERTAETFREVIQSNHFLTALWLLQHNESLVQHESQFALQYAMEQQNYDMATLLTPYVPSLDTGLALRYFDQAFKDHQPALMQFCVARGATLTAKNAQEKLTSLLQNNATEFTRDPKIAELFFTHGAQLSQEQLQMHLDAALGEKYTDFARVLVNHGATMTPELKNKYPQYAELQALPVAAQ